MLQLAKLLHFRGFQITFVNTEFNHRRLLKSRGPESVKGLPDFRFETIPDGLPTLDQDRTQDIPALCKSIANNCHPPFLNLLKKLSPPITCIVSDAVMSFSLQAAEELGIPEYAFYTPSACGTACYLHYPELIHRGLVPLKDESCLSNGYLDTAIDWMVGMKDMRVRHLPSFIRTTDMDDVMLNYDLTNARNTARAKAVILNTFEELEQDALDGVRSKFSLGLFTIGPLAKLCRQISSESPSNAIGANLWKEDEGCLEWLDSREARSVVYVNFGSITVMTAEQMREFAWGLANSNHHFLWVIRPDLVSGEAAILPPGFLDETEGRCLLASWCSQERLLDHPSVGGFLTHCGWNSMLESLSSGVPMLCWPFFAEQLTNCHYACSVWGVGMEIDKDVKRDEVEALVRVLMDGDGEKGKEMRRRAMEWKESATRAAEEEGCSYVNMEKLIQEMLHCKTSMSDNHN